MVRRTKKEFKPYNDYVDSPFELKWPTAFPLGKLQAVIKETNDYHSREIERLPQQSQAQIEHLLSRSIKQNKVLEIQLNSLDEYERVKPSILINKSRQHNHWKENIFYILNGRSNIPYHLEILIMDHTGFEPVTERL